MSDQYIVVCVGDDINRAYVLATRQVFSTHAEATQYMRTLALSRLPSIIAGDFKHLRFPIEDEVEL